MYCMTKTYFSFYYINCNFKFVIYNLDGNNKKFSSNNFVFIIAVFNATNKCLQRNCI